MSSAITQTFGVREEPKFHVGREVVSHLSNSRGFRDVPRTLNVVGDFGAFVNYVKNQGAHFFSKLAQIGSAGSAALAITEFVQNIKEVEESHQKLKNAKSLDTENAKREFKISKAKTDLAMAGVSCVNSGSEFAIFILESLFPAIAKAVTKLAVVMNITTLVTDGYAVFEGASKAYKSHEKLQQAKTKTEADKYNFKENIAFLKVAKNTASVGLAILGLIALSFASIAASKLFIGIGISLAAIFLITGITSHFYTRYYEVHTSALQKV